ncbi:hypothetical protein BG000_007125, partial [Podila horticola]
LNIQPHLRAFYSSKLCKIKRFHLTQVHRSTLDRAVSSICVTGGLGAKIPPGEPQPLFVVGDGAFGIARGPNFSQNFITFLKRKVLGLNGKIL